MKVIPIALAAHYRGGSTTLARLWRIARLDGVVFAFTDHDRALRFEGVRYLPSSSYDVSAISTRGELNVDNLEVSGILDHDGITDADIEAGLWDGATLELRQVNWADLSMGAEVLRVGELGTIQRKRAVFVAELRGLMQKLQNNIGRVVTPTCDATLGDARCKVELYGSPGFSVSGQVATSPDRRTFTASGLVAAIGYFNGGEVQFTDGENAGVRMDIKTSAPTGSPPDGTEFTLQLPMPYAMLPDEAFTVVPGCDKLKTTCKTKFGNLPNFRGFSFVPGADKALLIGGQ